MTNATHFPRPWRNPVAIRLAVLPTAALLACGGAQPRPSTPCMSDAECQGDRICHQGHCQFTEEALAQIRQSTGTVGPADMKEPVAPTRSTVTGRTSHPVPMFMTDPQHTGRSVYAGPHTKPKVLWNHRTKSRLYASAVVDANGDIYVGALDRSFISLSPKGELKWRYASSGKYYATAALLEDGTLITANQNKHITALSPQGELLWSTELRDGVDASPLVTPDDRVVAAADGIYALGSDGVVDWYFATAGHIRSSPALHPDGFIVVGTPDGQVLAIGMNGKKRWEVNVKSNVDGGPSIANDGTIFVGTDRGALVAIDHRGTIKWEFRTGDDIRGTPAIAADGTIIVGSYDRHVYAVDPHGTLRWKYRTAGRIRSSATIDRDGRIYIGSQDDTLYALSREGKLLWKFPVGRDIDAPVVVHPNGHLIVGADDGWLRAFGSK